MFSEELKEAIESRAQTEPSTLGVLPGPTSINLNFFFNTMAPLKYVK